MLDGISIQLDTTQKGERVFFISVQHAHDKLMAAAKGEGIERATPAKWVRFSKKFGITPGWLDIAIEQGLYTPAQGAGAVVPAKVSAEAVPATRQGLTKGAVISAFNGLHFDRVQWNKYLGDPANWLKECRLSQGSPDKKASATWNPVLIAVALYEKKIPIRKLDAVFVNLKVWADEWREESATFRD